MTDEQLALRVCDGDQLAFAELARRYRGNVHRVARRYFAAGEQPDDLTQAGLVGLYEACLGYDAVQSFVGLACTAIERAVIDAVKAARRLKHSPLNDAVSLQRPAVVGEHQGATLVDRLPSPEHHDPANQAQANEEMRTLAQLPDRLSPIEASVLARVLGGASLADAGHGHGHHAQDTAKLADNALLRVRRKARALLAA